MRVITIRHTKSKNNQLLEESYALFEAKRSIDSDIADNSSEDCKKVGQYLREHNIHIDKFYSSLHLRALKTMRYIANEYNPNTPREYFPNIFEVGGIYLKDKGFPGLTLKQVREQFPELIIPDGVDIENGWYKSDHKETTAELKERVKICIRKLKDMALNCEKDNYTICLVTHCDFLNAFYSFLCDSDFINGSLTFSHRNLGISSFTIDKNKKVHIDFLNFNCLEKLP